MDQFLQGSGVSEAHRGSETNGTSSSGDPSHVYSAPKPNPILAWIETATEHFIQSLHLVSPLILDLNNNGFEVSNLNGAAPSTVYFDMNNDGHPVRTGWVSGGDGLLCIDRNSNGTIDNQSELFGNNAAYANGFLNLGQYDSNHDGQITSADAQFAALRVWTDTNQDGVSQAAELHTLSDLGITAISLSTTAHSNTYVADNTETVTSTFTMNGVTQAIGDLWFRSDTSDSYATNADATLKGLVQTFQNGWSNAVLANPAVLNDGAALQTAANDNCHEFMKVA